AEALAKRVRGWRRFSIRITELDPPGAAAEAARSYVGRVVVLDRSWDLHVCDVAHLAWKQQPRRRRIDTDAQREPAVTVEQPKLRELEVEERALGRVSVLVTNIERPEDRIVRTLRRAIHVERVPGERGFDVRRPSGGARALRG